MNTEKICKYCKKIYTEETGYREFCSQLHYSKYRYAHNSKLREKIRKDNRERNRKRYKENKDYKARCKLNAVQWRKENPERAEQIRKKSYLKRKGK